MVAAAGTARGAMDGAGRGAAEAAAAGFAGAGADAAGSFWVAADAGAGAAGAAGLAAATADGAGILTVGAAVGFGGKLILTVSFLGCTFAASAGFGGAPPPSGALDCSSAITLFLRCFTGR